MAEPVDTNGAPSLSDYDKLIQEFEIQPDTVAKLEKLGITSLRSFSLLTPELVDSNLADVSLGQRLLVKAAIESGSRLRQRQQQQDELMGKATVPTFTFDSCHQPPGTRYVVSVTTKDNQVVALPVTKETYEKCFLKDPSTLAMLSTVATGAVAPSDEASRRVGVTIMESSGAAVHSVSKRRELPKYREAVRRIIETPSSVTQDRGDDQFHWTPVCTTALMLSYIEYVQRGRKPHWEAIAEKIRERFPEGSPVPTHEKCRLKIKNQKDKYERLVAINSTPGKKPRTIDRLLRAAFDPSMAGEITVDVSEFEGLLSDTGSPKRVRPA